MQILFMRIAGLDEELTVAVYSILHSDNLQRAALDALAKAKFGDGSEEFIIFSSVLNIIKKVGKLRHKLAHRRWGTSEAIPNALLLADAATTKSTALAHHALRGFEWDKYIGRQDSVPKHIKEAIENIAFDEDKILVYTVAELEAGVSEMLEASLAIHLYTNYIKPSLSDEKFAEISVMFPPSAKESLQIGTAAESLRRLSNLGLFQEARAQLLKGNNRNQQPPHESRD